MKLSLATRTLLGYLLIISLMGSVAIYSIVVMDRMRHEVSLIRRDLLPTGNRILRLTRESASYAMALKKLGAQSSGWLQQTLQLYQNSSLII